MSEPCSQYQPQRCQADPLKNHDKFISIPENDHLRQKEMLEILNRNGR